MARVPWLFSPDLRLLTVQCRRLASCARNTDHTGEKLPRSSSVGRRSSSEWTQIEREMREFSGTDWVKQRQTLFRKTPFLGNEQIADLVATHLRPDVEAGRYILEANPGLGYLSRRLLDMNCRQLRLFSSAKYPCLPALEQLAAENPDRVVLIRENLLELRAIIHNDFMSDSHREEACFAGIPRQPDWTQPAHATVFAVLSRPTEIGFLRSLNYMVPEQKSLFSLGRVDLLLFMTPGEYQVIVEVRNRPVSRMSVRSYNVFYHLLFEIEHLATVSTDNFFVLRTKDGDSDERFLVRMRPRAVINEVLLKPGDFEYFAFFVNQSLVRGMRIANSLDMWIPAAFRNVFVEKAKSDSLLRDVYFNDKFSHLSPEQMVELFRIFRAHEMFNHSSFRAAVEKQRYEPIAIREAALASRVQ